jgi:hypothetical protein
MSHDHSAALPLTTLLTEGAPLREAYHGSEPLLLCGAAPVDALPGIDRIDELVDGSLLRWPYFTVLKEGIRADKQAIVESRWVGGQPVGGFMNASGVRQALADGATLRLSAVSDWDGVTRDQARELAGLWPALIKSFMFFTPAGERGMLPHRDPSRVIVIQIAGEKEWTLYDAPETRNSRAGVDIDPGSAIDTFTVYPGDVLYLPHAYPHAATALDALSLHVTFTITEPTPGQLVRALIRDWLADPAHEELLRRSPSLALADRVAAVLASLGGQAAAAGPARLVDEAVAAFEIR